MYSLRINSPGWLAGMETKRMRWEALYQELNLSPIYFIYSPIPH